MSEDTKDILGILGVVMIILLLLAVFIVGILNLATWGDKYNCDVYSSQTGKQVKFAWWADTCYVKTPKGWFDYDQINQNTVVK